MTRGPWDHGDKTRDQRGYGCEHRKLRQQLLRQEPLCRLCLAKGRVTPASIADHIVGIAKGGALYDLANLHPVCPSCHQDKSNADRGFRVKRRMALDGWPEE